MKRYWIELICTFFLVLIIGMTGDPVAIGIGLIALVYFGGPISQAHFNPAITIVFYMRKRINIPEAMWYIGAQGVGAFLAAAFYYLIYQKSFFPAPSPDFDLWRCLLIEFVFTFLLDFVIQGPMLSSAALDTLESLQQSWEAESAVMQILYMTYSNALLNPFSKIMIQSMTKL